MRLTDCAFEYLGDADLLGKVEKGGLTSNGDPDGSAKLTLFYWDDGMFDEDGKPLPPAERRNPRMRMYDNMVEAKIEEIDDGSWRITGLSNRAEQHGAFAPGENLVSVKVVEGPACQGCSGR
jgi:hypothetical protein